jgi:hypothetical protein
LIDWYLGPKLTFRKKEKKLVDVAMKTAWYVLVEEKDTKESDCTMAGAYWLEGKDGEYRCFYLSRPENDHDCSDGDPSTVCFAISSFFLVKKAIDN